MKGGWREGKSDKISEYLVSEEEREVKRFWSEFDISGF